MGLLAEEETAKRYNIIDETLEHSPFPMFWCTDMAFIMANSAFCTLVGRSREEIQHLSFNNLIPEGSKQLQLTEIFPDNGQRDYKIVTRDIMTAAKQLTHIELRITRIFLEKDEKYYYGLVRSLSQGNSNEDVFKEQRQLLHLALNAARQGIWIWNAYNHERSYNNYAYEILGYPEEKGAPQTEKLRQLIHPDDIETAIAIWENFLTGENDFYEDEFRMLKNSGEYIWLKTAGSVIDRDSEGKPMRVAGIIRDINEKKLSELLIKDQTQKLLNYAFFNSHQLRSPISSIMGLTELLKNEYNPEFVTMLEKVVHQLDNAVHEINNMLWDKSTLAKPGGYNSGSKRITLIDSDKQLNIIYKKTFDKFTDAFDANSYTGAENALNMLLKGQLDTDIILLDADDKKIDVWQFLNNYEKTHRYKPIHLLTGNIDLANALKASEFRCVAGFLIKPIGKQDILNFITKFSN